MKQLKRETARQEQLKSNTIRKERLYCKKENNKVGITKKKSKSKKPFSPVCMK